MGSHMPSVFSFVAMFMPIWQKAELSLCLLNLILRESLLTAMKYPEQF
jgi:hypothetical protein